MSDLTITETLAPFIKAADGYVVQYHGEPVDEIKTAWRKLRKAAGLDNQVNPYSLRHTLGRHLRSRS